MVDEDIVIGYVLGYNDGAGAGGGVLIEKSVTENGRYIAKDDNADGYNIFNVNVNLKKAFEDGYRFGYDKGYDDGKNGEPSDDTPPEVSVSDIRPLEDGYDYPFLTTVSPDGKYTQVMYGVRTIDVDLAMYYYVDTYFNGKLSRHDRVLICPGLGNPGNTPTLNADGSVTILTRWEDGTSKTEVWGPYLNYTDNTIWSV